MVSIGDDSVDKPVRATLIALLSHRLIHMLSEAAGRLVSVALDTPGLGPLDYQDLLEPGLEPGEWVLVPLGRRWAVGVVVEVLPAGGSAPERPLRPVEERLPAIPPVRPEQFRLARFVARYYRRGLGPTLLATLPAWLKRPGHHQARARQKTPLAVRLAQDLETRPPAGSPNGPPRHTDPGGAALTPEQQAAYERIASELEAPAPRPILIHGLTGTGKTRLYQHVMGHWLERHPQDQVLVLVPEIGLTPQLMARMQAAFPGQALATLHSGLTDRSRAEQWMLASRGRADIVVGTRLSVLCPLPRLGMIVVDEEHDPSYRQQEGLRYSARDLAVWLGQDRAIPVLLASATPSLESWVQAQRHKYARVTLSSLASGARRPEVTLIDLVKYRPDETGLSAQAFDEIRSALHRREQVLLFVNRRGWAPVLVCDACGWRAQCKACEVPSVLHRQRGRWRSICHHCGRTTAPPTACPDCGHQDLGTLGQGTQRLEASLQAHFPEAVIARMDRDEVRTPKALEDLITRIESREVSLLVGTQMAAKGHDFAGLRLVVVVDADAQLSNPDFRGPEWLYAGIAQVAGRAGRHPGQSGEPPPRVLIQTRYPQHPVFAALTDPDPLHGFERFWSGLAEERQAASLPPFGSMALVSASHPDEAALTDALDELSDLLGAQPVQEGLRVSAPVPRYPVRLSGRARWQLVIEAPSRRVLQAALDRAEDWVAANRSRLQAQIEVDPLGLG